MGHSKIMMARCKAGPTCNDSLKFPGCNGLKTHGLAAKAESDNHTRTATTEVVLEAELKRSTSCAPTPFWVVSGRGCYYYMQTYIASCVIKASGPKAHAHECGFAHIIWFVWGSKGLLSGDASAAFRARCRMEG